MEKFDIVGTIKKILQNPQDKNLIKQVLEYIYKCVEANTPIIPQQYIDNFTCDELLSFGQILRDQFDTIESYRKALNTEWIAKLLDK